jgi:hypothetical protein
VSAPDFQPPDTSLFSYTANGTGVTQSATYDSARGLSVHRTDTSLSGEHHGFIGKAVPSGSSWEAIMRYKQAACGNDYVRRGLALLESATGKSVLIGLNMQQSTPRLMAMASSSLDNAFATSIVSVDCAGDFPEWLRWTWDGTNYKGFISYDGQATWVQLCSFTPTTYFTTAPDKIGLDIEVFGSLAIPPYCTIISYDDPDV